MGRLEPSWLDLAILGRPDFQSRGPKILILKGLGPLDGKDIFVTFVTRPKFPPYRETGVAIPLSHCVFCGIADYRCYTPTSFHKSGLSQSRDRPWRGGIREKACP